jgi:hypothetical protein
MARKHKRHYRMHGLAGLKDDAMDIAAVGGGAVIGIAAAKFVTSKVEDMKLLKDDAGAPAAWAKWASAAVPAVIGLGVLYASAKAGLSGRSKQVALGAAAGMGAVTIGKLVVAASPDIAGKLYLNGLGANVDSYDSGLLAGLGEFDASVARYMMAGSPTQVQSLMGAPLQVQAFAGAPTQIQSLAAAPMSATLM